MRWSISVLVLTPVWMFAACESGPSHPADPQAPAVATRALQGDATDPFLITASADAAVGVATGSLAPGAGQYYRLTVPAGHSGLRIAAVCSATCSLYVRRTNPTTGASLGSTLSELGPTVFVAPASTTVDNNTYIEVRAAAGNPVAYTLRTDSRQTIPLTWDPGTLQAGTQLTTQPDTVGGDYAFTLTLTALPTYAFRSVLTVGTGEADLYLQKTSLPTIAGATHRSTRVGSDGVALATGYAAGETWYYRVRANAGAAFTLHSGELYVRDLGTMQSGELGAAGDLEIGPEGAAWFKTSAPANALAWRIMAPEAVRVLVNDTAVPIAATASSYDYDAMGQMLLVPPYLANQGYLVALVGTPGPVHVESGLQTIEVPLEQPGVVGTDNFDFELPVLAVGGARYRTYRIDVPVSAIVWQVMAQSQTGDVDVYLRKAAVPSETANSGFSEVTGVAVADSVTLVPTTLTNGIWYVTIKARTAVDFTLVSGEPVVTDIPFLNDASPVLNDVAFQDQVGWRYFRVPNIPEQVGALGWILELQDHVPGTEIAIRRNAVPGRRQYRNNTTTITKDGHYDYSSTLGFLERPNHPADIWYIGINQPTTTLGAFKLRTRLIEAPLLNMNSGSIIVTGQVSGRLQWFRVVVPENALGWDLRLEDITSGLPRIVTRSDLLPVDFVNTTTYPITWYNAWQSGEAWAADQDMTQRDKTADGVSERGRRFQLGMGTPLQYGTYFVAVGDTYVATPTGVPMSYRVQSRGIGQGDVTPGVPWTIQVQDLPFAGGEAIVADLPAREIRYFKVPVPVGADSFALEMVPTSGEALLALRQGFLPNNDAYDNNASSGTSWAMGRRMQKTGAEFYYGLPAAQAATLPGANYFFAVASEGQSPSATDRVGTGTSSFRIKSLGTLPVNGVAGAPPAELSPTEPLVFAGEPLLFGQIRAYRFTVPAGLSHVELSFANVIGKPYMKVSRPPNMFPTVSPPYRDVEGGGTTAETGNTDQTITLVEPSGTYTVVTYVGTGTSDASYDLRITPRAEDTIAFNDARAEVVSQPRQTWRYWKVVVPDGALGWDLRLVDVTSGTPRIVVRRDNLPTDLSTTCSYQETRNDWVTGCSLAPSLDVTNRTYPPGTGNTGSVYGRTLVVGMTSPLQPGTYHIGVIDSTTGTTGVAMSYGLVSRGIGIGNDAGGTPWKIPVADLPWEGEATVTALPAREIAYFRLVVPANALSWELELAPTSGEGMFAVRKDRLPNNWAAPTYLSDETSTAYVAGAARQKPDFEHFYRYPNVGQTVISAGTYYLGVVSEGQSPTDANHIGSGTSDLVIRSKGEVDVQVAATPLQVGSAVTWSAQHSRYGEQRAYRFQAEAGMSSMDIQLLNVTGNADMRVIPGQVFLNPHETYVASEGGQNGFVDDNNFLVTIPEPSGWYTVLVTSEYLSVPGVGITYPPLDFDLKATAIGEQVVAFNGGTAPVSGQVWNTWRYFRIEVPADALGWDLRLENITSGTPRMVIRRDDLPANFTTTLDSSRFDWPTGKAWAVGSDFTGRTWGPIGSPSVDVISGRVATLGMGAPLVPGTYYVGVSGSWTTTAGAALDYTLVSRGIGSGTDTPGQPWALPVVDLPWQGSLTVTDVPARYAAFYRLTIPSDAATSAVELRPSSGEGCLMVRKGTIPTTNGAYSAYPSDNDGYSYPIRQRKQASEFWYRYPANTTATTGGGVYYLAVVSEGQVAAVDYARNNIGTGSASFTLESVGALPLHGGPDRLVSKTQGVTFAGESLRYGEHKLYRVRVENDVPAYEVRLKSRVGNPVFHSSVTPYFGFSVPVTSNESYDASEYGWTQVLGDDIAATTVGKTGDITVVVHANTLAGVETAATFDLVVTARTVTPANWDGGRVSATLADKEVTYFRYDIPRDCDGIPLAAWILTPENVTGSLTIRTRKDALPTPSAYTISTTSSVAQTIITPPDIDAGTWYVSVTANTLSSMTLFSEELRERRAWDTPPKTITPATPGVAAPFFADTGTNPDGTPINAGDRGSDVAQGRWHFYRVYVPPGNTGVLSTYLEALSGNPELYVRRQAAPSTSRYDWQDTLTGTTYGHIVPENTRLGYDLVPGHWWFGIHAPSSNVRYRLQLSVGRIETLTQDGGLAENHALAAGDMRHYRVHTGDTALDDASSAPLQWNLRLLQDQGDVFVYVREVLPTGLMPVNQSPSRNAGTSAYIKDWVDDRANVWGTPSPLVSPVLDDSGTKTLPIPAVMPGTDYIVSVYAAIDSTYDLESTVGASRLHIDGILDYKTGTVDISLPAGAQRVYRVDLPADAARWKHDATTGTNVWLRVQLGTLPPSGTSTSGDWNNAGTNTSADLDKPLYHTNAEIFNYPWMPGRSYYLVAENRNAAAQQFRIVMDGRDKTDDSDSDQLPDWWEYNYFNALTKGTSDDTGDSDELGNLQEYQLGTVPTTADTDGDSLWDGLEVREGFDPLTGDSDGDACCDGEDPDPLHFDEACYIIRLTMHQYTDGAWGYGYGTNEHQHRIAALFTKDATVKQHWFAVRAFDVDSPDEIEVRINGTFLTYLPVSADNAHDLPTLLWVETSALRTGDNWIEFRQKNPSDTWGVTDLGLFTFGDSLGYDSTHAYDSRRPDGFRILWFAAAGDQLFELQTFDIESPDEVRITYDALPLLDLPVSGNLAWTPYLQMPLLALDTGTGLHTLEVLPLAAGDGDYQIRFVDKRPTLTTTFGTNFAGDENEHAKTQLHYVFPYTPVRRELKYDYTVSLPDGAVSASGTNLETTKTLPARSAFGNWQVLCSDADAIDVSDLMHIAANIASPVWQIKVTYYGVVLDFDNDGINDCDDCDPKVANAVGPGQGCDSPDDPDACPDDVYTCTPTGGTVCTDVPSGGLHDEICDGLDNDCNGAIDESFEPAKGEACDGADADACDDGHWVCSADGLGLDCDDGASTSPPGAVEGAGCDGPDEDTCSDGHWVCAADDSGLACDDGDETAPAGSAEGASCDGTDGDTCKGGAWHCTADGSALACDDDAFTLADQGAACDGADSDSCTGGKLVCDVSGTGLVCDDDAAGLANEGFACDGTDSDTCAGGTWVCNAAGTGLDCDDDAESLGLEGQPCDGTDSDTCAGGIWECDAAGTGLVCSDDAGGLAQEGLRCDGGDSDTCLGGVWGCNAAGTGLDCSDDATSLSLENQRCDGTDSDTCAGGTWRCNAAGTGLDCDDDAQSLDQEGQRCDGDDSDTCAGGSLVCDAAGTGLVCDDDAESLSAEGQRCDGDDGDTCAGGAWVCNTAGTGLDCTDDADSLDLQGAACDGTDSDTCAGGHWVCDEAGTALVCDDDAAGLAQQGEPCDGLDGDSCAGGKLVCNAAGTALDCDDDAASLGDEGQRCDGADSDTCAGGKLVCNAAGTGLDCDDDSGSLDEEGQHCDGADGDTCAGGTWVCNAAGIGLDCNDDASSLDLQGAACDGADSDTCAGGTWVCNAAGIGLDCTDDASSLDLQGAACDGTDSDTCAGGAWVCDTTGTALVCDDDAASLEQEGTRCDGDDTDSCTDGTWVCSAAGTGLVCNDDATSFALEGTACDGTDADTCAGGLWVCNAVGTGLDCTDDPASLPDQGLPCDGDDSDSCAGGTWVCGAAGTDLVCNDDAGSLVLEGATCDGDDSDTCAGGVWVCNAAGTGLACNDDATSLALQGEPCDGADLDSCPSGQWVCDAAGTGLVCNDDDPSLNLEGKPCDGDDTDTCSGGVWVCSVDGTALDCTDDSASLALQGERCDGADGDTCLGGVWTCDAAGTGLDCSDGADTLADEGARCDGADSDACLGGVWACDAAGTALTCTDDAASLVLAGQACDGDDGDTCAGGTWVCDAAGTGIVCSDDAVGLAGEGAACDGDDADTCKGGTFVCNAAGTALVCNDDDVALTLEGERCDGDDRDSCKGGTWACDAAGHGLVCTDDATSLELEDEACDGSDEDHCLGGVWACDAAGTGLVCTDDDVALTLEGKSCDGDDLDQCADGVWVCAGDGLACDDDASATAETCNALDDDCDGSTDEDFPYPQTSDADCDGEPTASDCDDHDPSVQKCPDPCIDDDDDHHDAMTLVCPTGDDCDDGDAFATYLAIDGDCDRVVTSEDCDDDAPEIGAITADLDCDRVANETDNCPTVANPEQVDGDGDHDGDVCDTCPAKPNPDQFDSDADGVGDACDPCPGVPETTQFDSDGDGLGDKCDACPTDATNQCADRDHDGIFDVVDNCVDVPNVDQRDADGDHIGDACDPLDEGISALGGGGCTGAGAEWGVGIGAALLHLLMGLLRMRARRPSPPRR